MALSNDFISFSLFLSFTLSGTLNFSGMPSALSAERMRMLLSPLSLKGTVKMSPMVFRLLYAPRL